MRGHVKQRGASWAFWLDAGQHPAQRCSGCNRRSWVERGRPAKTCERCGDPMGEPAPERRQLTKSGFATRKAAQQALTAALAGLDKGADPFPTDLTVDQWATRWQDTERVRKLRPHTRSRYRQILTDHVLPVIASMRLVDVRARHVRAVLDAVDAKGLGRSVVETRAVMSSMMRAALEAELIDANPVAAIRPPRHERHELEVPSAAELVALIEAAKGTTWEIPLLIAATTGLRRSEVLGLKWGDMDLETGRFRVVRSLQRVRDENGSRIDFLGGKTERSRRQATLPVLTIERLRRWRVEQAARRLRLGPAWSDLDLVCDRGDGGPLDPDAFTKGFKRLAKQAELRPGVRLHDVRHGVATTMLAKGVHPAIASAVLGHASPAFTMKAYQHVLDGMTDVAADAIGDALDAAGGSTR